MRRHGFITATLLLGLMAAFATGCQGGGNDPSAVLGTWQIHDPDTGDVTNQITFKDGGRFTLMDDSGNTSQGSYSIDGDTMKLQGTDDQGASLEAEFTYYAGADQFVLGALLPQGDVNGPVGTWTGRLRSVSNGKTTIDETDTYDLSTDGSATVHAVASGSTSDATGTWTTEDGGVVVTFVQQNITFHLHLQLIDDGAALGGQVYTRA